MNIVGPGETSVTLPGGATMVDVAAGRILYQRAGDLGAVTISNGANVLLVDGTPAQPVLGQLDAAGLAWARGATVNWRVGPLPAAVGFSSDTAVTPRTAGVRLKSDT